MKGLLVISLFFVCQSLDLALGFRSRTEVDMLWSLLDGFGGHQVNFVGWHHPELLTRCFKKTNLPITITIKVYSFVQV